MANCLCFVWFSTVCFDVFCWCALSRFFVSSLCGLFSYFPAKSNQIGNQIILKKLFSNVLHTKKKDKRNKVLWSELANFVQQLKVSKFQNEFMKSLLGPTSLIHHYDVEGVLGLGEREHIPPQWPRVSLLTWGTLQIRIRFVRLRSDPTLEQTNKWSHCFSQNMNQIL